MKKGLLLLALCTSWLLFCSFDGDKNNAPVVKVKTVGTLRSVLSELGLTDSPSLIIVGSIDSTDIATLSQLASSTLVDIDISATDLKKIPANAFDGELPLTIESFIFPDSLVEIGDAAFFYCSLNSITIPNSVTTIGSSAFSLCEDLNSIALPNSVTKIGKDAFSMCCKLTSVTLPNSVTKIESDTFRDCETLTSITIPSSVTTIGFMAFSYCESLTSITIPCSVTTIGMAAFSGCSKLTTVECLAVTPPILGNDVFSDTPNKTLKVPAQSVKAYKANMAWRDAFSTIESL